MKELKYDKELYIGSEIYGWGDEEISCYKEKLVKCRKPHTCASCESDIQVGDFAIYESGFMDGEAISSHTCIKCIEEWLEESGQIDVDEEEE